MMFKEVINHPGFWKSVAGLTVAFIGVFTFVKAIFESFDFAFIMNNPSRYIIAITLAAFVYAFIVTFGKFRNKLKQKK